MHSPAGTYAEVSKLRKASSANERQIDERGMSSRSPKSRFSGDVFFGDLSVC